MSALLLLAASAMPAFAGTIEIIDPIGHFVEDSENGDHFEVFMTISNTSSAQETLYAVRTKVAKAATPNTIEKNAVHSGNRLHGGHDEAHMTTASLVVPAGGEAQFDGHGMHIMLWEPKRHYEPGETFAVTLFFEHAGRVTVNVTVEEDEGDTEMKGIRRVTRNMVGAFAPGFSLDDNNPVFPRFRAARSKVSE